MVTAAERLHAGLEGTTYRIVFCTYIATISSVAFQALGAILPHNQMGNTLAGSLPTVVTLLNMGIAQHYVPTYSEEEKWMKILISALSGAYVALKLFNRNLETELAMSDILLAVAAAKFLIFHF